MLTIVFILWHRYNHGIHNQISKSLLLYVFYANPPPLNPSFLVFKHISKQSRSVSLLFLVVVLSSVHNSRHRQVVVMLNTQVFFFVYALSSYDIYGVLLVLLLYEDIYWLIITRWKCLLPIFNITQFRNKKKVKFYFILHSTIFLL